MDGREPLGISYVPSYVHDPWDEAQFNRWYKEVHFADVVETKVLLNPVMFHNALTPLPPGTDKFIVMYELYHGDEEIQKQHRLLQARLRKDFDQTKGVRSPNRGQYRVVRRLFGQRADKRSQSIYVERLDCSDSSRAEELRSWYADVRLPGMMATDIFHTGSFGESPAGEERSAERPTTSRFLALFESSDADANGVAAMIKRRFPFSDLPEFVRVVEIVAAKRDSP